PYGVVVAAAWSWRILLITVVSAIAVWLLSHLSLLIIPLLIAALLATLLQPVHRLLLKFKFPPVVSSLLLTATLIFVVSTLLTIAGQDRKSTRLNSSHVSISYAVCCLKKKKLISNTSF